MTDREIENATTLEEKRKLLSKLLQRKVNKSEYLIPVSHNQRGLWLQYQASPESSAYNVAFAVYLHESIDPFLLQLSLKGLVENHSALRTTYPILDGVPMQLVHKQVSLDFSAVDASGFSEEELHRRVTREYATPFDIVKGPLFRTRLFTMTANEHVLLLSFHHVSVDFWSIGLLMNELEKHYNSLLEKGILSFETRPSEYSDFVTWQAKMLQDPKGRVQRTYWTSRLAGETSILPLPTDRPRPTVQTFSGASCEFALETSLSDKLRKLAARNKTTLFTTLLGAFYTLLFRYTHQAEILVGSSVSGRTVPDLRKTVGNFANMVVLKADLSGDPAFVSLLRQLHQTVSGALAHQDYPFSLLLEALAIKRNPSHSPLFQPAFGYQDIRRIHGTQSTFKMDPFPLQQQEGQFDLFLGIEEHSSSMKAVFKFNTDLFERSTIQKMSSHYCVLLTSIVETPEERLSKLNLVTEAERRMVLHEWNATEVTFEEKTSIQGIFEKQAERSLDAIALVGGGHRLSYRQVNQEAERLASLLQDLEVGPETRVGIIAERAVTTPLAMLAVLKAGGAYVAIDPSMPEERIRFVLGDAQIKVILVQRSSRHLVPKGAWSVLPLDIPSSPDNATSPPIRRASGINSRNLAYVTYTSGSTGTPKGVMVEHRQVVNFIHAGAYSEIGLESAFLLLTPFFFDASGVGVYWTLCNGGTLVIPSEQDMRDPRILCQLMESEKITHTASTPSLYLLLLDQDPSKIRGLKMAIVGGEACPPSLVAKHFAIAPLTRLSNQYGPTEATIFCTHCECRPEHALLRTVPIGAPIQNSRIYILDDSLNPVPIGISGEIYVGGACVARGYLNLNSLTEERFLDDPFASSPEARLYRTGDRARWLANGQIEYLGRTDDQVKVRGFRIEIGEIETAVLNHPNVAEVAVNVHETDTGEKHLVAYVVSRSGCLLSSADITSHLEAKLPGYMVPSYVLFMEKLPLTRSGKVDRKSLPEPNVQIALPRDGWIEPRTPLEKDVAAAFMDVLGIEHISMSSDFFELGGTSLQMPQLIPRLADKYSIDLPMNLMFQAPTVAGVANLIEIYQRAGDYLAWTLDDLAKEYLLDPDISPDGLPEADYLDPKNVLLTGSTGYLGAAILESLMARTKANVFCLVRAADEEEGLQRITTKMIEFRMWKAGFASRIIAVPGDLAKPMLGLSPSRFVELGMLIDSIYHPGALVNFVYSYSMLKKTNVDGTHEILRLACQSRLKAVHFVSTVDVFYSTRAERPFLEAPIPNSPEYPPEGGYPVSKWVSEKIVAMAQERGVPVCIYRPGLMMSHSKTGASNITDYLLVGIKGFKQLGVVPSINRLFDPLSVDIVADTIVHVSIQKASFEKIYFHVWNTIPINMNKLYDWLKSYGYAFDVVPYRDARDRALVVDPSHPIYPLLPILPPDLIRYGNEWDDPLAKNPELLQEMNIQRECRNTTEMLAQSGITFPPVDEKFVHRCMDYLVETGFLDTPLAVM